MTLQISNKKKTYDKEDIERFAEDPNALMTLRKTNEIVVNSIFSEFLAAGLIYSY